MSHAIKLHDGLGQIAVDPADGILLAYGSTVPADATVGYAPGCQFIKTDGTSNLTYNYVNVGTKASANFDPNALQIAAATPAIAAARVLSAADSGGVFSVAKTSAYAITLPTPAQGLRFKFLVIDTGANIVTISNGAAHLFGIVSVNSVNVVMTGTTISLASAGSLGDWISFEGISSTEYLINGATLAAADITIA